MKPPAGLDRARYRSAGLNSGVRSSVSRYAISGGGCTMRTAVATAILGTALVAAPLSQTSQDGRAKDSLERTFSQNGRIRMDLSAGDYTISGSPDNRIRLEWSVRDSDQLANVHARADVRDRDATITTDGPSNKGFKVAIQVPRQADLYVRLT